LRLAGETAETYELRGVDSIHLASARWLGERAGVACTVVVFDQRLRDGAARAGLAVLP
jgi:predicted nucleic acid-binding protein